MHETYIINTDRKPTYIRCAFGDSSGFVEELHQRSIFLYGSNSGRKRHYPNTIFTVIFLVQQFFLIFFYFFVLENFASKAAQYREVFKQHYTAMQHNARTLLKSADQRKWTCDKSNQLCKCTGQHKLCTETANFLLFSKSMLVRPHLCSHHQQRPHTTKLPDSFRATWTMRSI